MRDDSYIRTVVTIEFVQKVLKPYTSRLIKAESKKNGTQKNRVTKRTVCRKIIEDLQNNKLI